ncbi:MAG: DNA methyltransferase [Planctomycetota bacterium]
MVPGHAHRFDSDLEGSPIEVAEAAIAGMRVPLYTGEFWTSGQRQACALHEISYRACFKPQLPAYFIRRLTREGDRVYDPFSGRGTTALEAALMRRVPLANDISPLSALLAQPRLSPPSLAFLESRLDRIPEEAPTPPEADVDLSMFFHPETLREILRLRAYLERREASGQEDDIDSWIRMVATNRLTGHSPGFFSVYTLPPNQAVSADSQKKINAKRNQQPTYRDTRALILRKSRQLLKGLTPSQTETLTSLKSFARFFTNDARRTPGIAEGSVQLTVTSPPFLDVVQYADDNWLRCWFNNLDVRGIGSGITMARTVESWSGVMGDVFRELHRITAPGGHVAFEVGEVRSGRVKLEEAVVPLGLQAGFDCVALLLNAQPFTKTANIWGISNNRSGTNSNRIVVFRR